MSADGDRGEEWPHLGVEAVAVHAEIAWCIAEPDQPRDGWRWHRISSPSEGLPTIAAIQVRTRPRWANLAIGHVAQLLMPIWPRGPALRGGPNLQLPLFVSSSFAPVAPSVAWSGLPSGGGRGDTAPGRAPEPSLAASFAIRVKYRLSEGLRLAISRMNTSNRWRPISRAGSWSSAGRGGVTVRKLRS